MKSKLFIWGTIILLVALVVGVMNRPVSNTGPRASENESTAALTSSEMEEVSQAQASVLSTLAATRYTHPRFGFSFEKPEGYTVGLVGGGSDGESLIVQPANGDIKKAFQIYITQPGEPVAFSSAEIRDFLAPGVSTASRITIGDGAKGVMFKGNNPSFDGTSFEIWFYEAGNLYQVSSYGEFSGKLQDIIGTWRFK